jgi:RimJ/RimL family protein N-acetyltransferase
MITEESFIDFKCPYCGELNSFPKSFVGFVRECVNCLESLIVPEAGSEVGREIPIPITTERLILRRLGASDWKDLLEFRFDSEEDVLRWLEKDRNVKLTTLNETFSLGIQTRDGGKVIGCLGLKFTDEGFIEAEISPYMNQKYRGEDFDAEALAAVLGFCFERLKMHRVIAKWGSKDAEGCRLFENAGMRREGEFVKHYHMDGEWRSTVWYAMLDEEYPTIGDNPAPQSAA